MGCKVGCLGWEGLQQISMVCSDLGAEFGQYLTQKWAFKSLPEASALMATSRGSGRRSAGFGLGLASAWGVGGMPSPGAGVLGERAPPARPLALHPQGPLSLGAPPPPPPRPRLLCTCFMGKSRRRFSQDSGLGGLGWGWGGASHDILKPPNGKTY